MRGTSALLRTGTRSSGTASRVCTRPCTSSRVSTTSRSPTAVGARRSRCPRTAGPTRGDPETDARGRSGRRRRRRAPPEQRPSPALRVPARACPAPHRLPGFGPRPPVLLQFERTELALQLLVAAVAIRIERAVRERALDGAAGLALVAAVAEATMLEERFDVAERRAEPFFGIPELELPHARRVEHEPTTRERDQLARRRRVPPAPVTPQVAGRERLLAEQLVDERRLADARRAEQRSGAVALEVRAELVDPGPGHAADRVHGDADRDQLDLGDRLLDVVAEVRLREDDDGIGAALPRRREVALEPAQVEVPVEAGDDEDRVDVGGEHLLADDLERLLARERRSPRQDRLNGRTAALGVGAQHDPVARDRYGAAVLGLETQPAGELTRELAGFGPDEVGAAVLDRDASRNQAVAAVRGERGFEVGAPAERLQRCCQQARTSSGSERTRTGPGAGRGGSGNPVPDFSLASACVSLARCAPCCGKGNLSHVLLLSATARTVTP